MKPQEVETEINPEAVPPPTRQVLVPAISGRSGISSIHTRPEMYHGRSLYPSVEPLQDQELQEEERVAVALEMSAAKSQGTQGTMTDETQASTAPPPLLVAAATPSTYEAVIADLRQRGLVDLATQILRLTALDTSTHSAMAADETETDKKPEMEQQPHTSERRRPGSLSPQRQHSPVRTMSPQKEISSAATLEQAIAKKCAAPNCKGKAIPASSKVVKVSPTSSSKSVSSLTAALKVESKLKGGAPTTTDKDSGDRPPESDSDSSAPVHVGVPRTTALNAVRSTCSFPGAYNVTPSGHFNGSSSDSDLSLIGDPEEDEHLGRLLADHPTAAAEEGRSDPEQGLDQEDNEDRTTTLEAVRVDDIMTVKAEPLADERYKLYKLVACVALALIALTLTFSLALTLGRNEPDSEPPVQIYDNETRFQLIHNLLMHRLEPYYNLNYNASNGSQILQETLETPQSPQFQALDWIARQDPEMQAIPRPVLDMYQDHHHHHQSSSQDLFERRLMHFADNETLPTAAQFHDRIVQRFALAVLFYATGSTNWTNTFEFLSDGPECDWSGAILCVPDVDDNDDEELTNSTFAGAVTHLDLHSNGLQGSIPVELAALTQLKSLKLSKNKLQGTLPQALATLTNLQQIDLGFNKQLSGTIPEALYEGWSQLESWEMNECQISGTIASSIGNLGQLKKMLWRRNHLGGAIPPQFWSLTNMESMDLNQQRTRKMKRFANQTIATEIGLWSNLKSFIFHGLELRGTIPSELGELTGLHTLQLANNHLTGSIPTQLGALTAMTRLTLSINGLTGTIPTEFLEMTVLRQLYLQNTMLTGDAGFICEAVDEGILPPMDIFRVNMKEVTGCYCCTCCLY